MKVCSNSSFTLSDTLANSGSRPICSGPPPRSSSQFAPQVTLVSSPVIKDLGRATGVVSIAGADSRFS